LAGDEARLRQKEASSYQETSNQQSAKAKKEDKLPAARYQLKQQQKQRRQTSC
jgi:hypothetical protein